MGGKLVNAQLQSSIGPARTVLLIAYHFPPLRGSSGLQRTLRFAQHLPKFGWRPIVLSIDPRAYEESAQIAGNEVPADLTVHRAFGFNTATQLSLFGRYPKVLALPDRWSTWRLWAVPKALRIIRSEGVSAIWSTFPVATAHRIGLDIAERTGLPWIAEFRDPMWQHDWPPEPTANRVWKALETRIFERADWTVFTAPSAIDLYRERFPHLPAERRVLIENGFDEETFRRAAQSAPAEVLAPPTAPRPVTLLHSGIIYRSERDPTQFFAAVSALKGRGRIDAQRLQIILRASGDESDYSRELQRLGIADIVKLESGIDYMSALREMLSVDGLLLLQASNCNAQVPAKLYEYLRAQRPILALTDPAGDTARTLESAGAGLIARLDNQAEIEAALSRFLDQIAAGDARCPSPQTIARYTREAKSCELAKLLDQALQSRPK
ncbi:MAG: glycosyltransferase [Gammaproteobacteria bacterium]